MRIPWVQLEPLCFVLGALDRILRMPSASPQSPTPRRVMQESRQWERELRQAINLAHSFLDTVPMVAHAVVSLERAMDSGRQQAARQDIGSSKHTDSVMEPTLSAKAVTCSCKPDLADVDKAIVMLPKMCAGLRDCFLGAYQDEVATLLVTPGYTSCAFVGSTSNELVGVAIVDTAENHICYVASWDMPGRAVSEIVVQMLRPGNITLHDSTNEQNKHFWPGLGFKMNTDRALNPNQSPAEMIASKEVVLAKIDQKWQASKKRWVQGADFRVVRFKLVKNDLMQLYQKVFGRYMSSRATSRATVDTYRDKLSKDWLSKPADSCSFECM